MKIFDKTVTDRVAEQFCLYFRRKRLGKKMAYRDAADIIAYIQGYSSPIPKESTSTDYSTPRVQGGGKSPPSENRIVQIIASMTEANEWDKVFDEILSLYDNTEEKRVLLLAFDKLKTTAEISRLTGIPERTIRAKKAAVIEKAAVLACKKNLVKICLRQP